MAVVYISSIPFFFLLDYLYILMFLFVLVLLHLFILNEVVEESVLLIPKVGLQYSTKYVWSNHKRSFIHWHDIDSVIINEVIYLQRVIYMLEVIVQHRNENKYIYPLFMKIKPKLKYLESAYQELHKVLQSG